MGRGLSTQTEAIRTLWGSGDPSSRDATLPEPRLRRSILPSGPPPARSFPSGEKARVEKLTGCSYSPGTGVLLTILTVRRLPVFRSQSVTVPSAPPAARSVPSGEKATPEIGTGF